MGASEVVFPVELGIVLGGLFGGEVCFQGGCVESSADLAGVSERNKGECTICFTLPAWMSMQGLNFVRGMT